jgi:hypothetical protein
MATWRFDFKGLKIVGTDENGWPITDEVYPSLEFEDAYIRRVEVNALKWAREELPDIHGLAELGYERVDKRTNSGYVESIHNPWDDDRSTLQLSEEQTQRIKDAQQKILAKARRDVPDTHVWRGDCLLWRVGGDATALYEGNSGGRGFFTHQQVEATIKQLQNFYSRVTPDELIILNTGHRSAYEKKFHVSHDELKVIRKLVR